MTRCEEFYEKVERDGNFCGMRKDHYTELMAYIELLKENPHLWGISETAAKPLNREKDPEVKAKALETLGKQVEHGSIATAKQVSTILENIRGRIPTKGGNHMGAVKPKDLSGIYIPPATPYVPEVKEDEDKDNYDEEYEYKNGEGDAEENDSMGDIEVMPEMNEDPAEDTSQIPEPGTPEEIPAAYKRTEDEEEEGEEEEETDNNQESEEDAKAKEADRLEMLNRMEERRADVEAEKIVVTCLKLILSKNYPKQKLSWLVETALREVLIPDGGCPMPDSSVTKGGAITTNLGGR